MYRTFQDTSGHCRTVTQDQQIGPTEIQFPMMLFGWFYFIGTVWKQQAMADGKRRTLSVLAQAQKSALFAKRCVRARAKKSCTKLERPKKQSVFQSGVR